MVSLSSPALAAVFYCCLVSVELVLWCCISFIMALAPPPKVEDVLNLEF